MSGKRAISCWLCVAVVLCAWPGIARAAPIVINDPGTRVVDQAHVLTPAASKQIEDLLAKLEEVTGAQVKVLTVPTTGDEDIFTFAQRQYQLWKLGSKEKRDGALIVLAPDDHKVRIHTGYGLEGALPDSWIGSLSREIAGEYFKQGKYAEGLQRMTIAVVNQIADDQGKKVEGAPNIRHAVPHEDKTASNIMLVVFLLIMIYVIYRNYRQQGRGGRFVGPGWSGGSGWSGGFGGFGGSFGGGSFGGGSFGGGSFGGSFGGGGSSGGGGGGASW